MSYLQDIVIGDIIKERERQDEKWGEQNWKSTDVDRELCSEAADGLKATCQRKFKDKSLTWRDIFNEELFEALAEEPGSEAMEKELIQAAAVLVAWIECIRRRREHAVYSAD